MRADLRLSDLERKKVPSKLMNVKVPDNVSEGIDRGAEELGCSNTAVVIALLNEGLDPTRGAAPGPHPSSGPERVAPSRRVRRACPSLDLQSSGERRYVDVRPRLVAPS